MYVLVAVTVGVCVGVKLDTPGIPYGVCVGVGVVVGVGIALGV